MSEWQKHTHNGSWCEPCVTHGANLAIAHAAKDGVARDLYRALVSEHGHDEKHGAPWPACLPVHIAMNRYRDAVADGDPA